MFKIICEDCGRKIEIKGTIDVKAVKEQGMDMLTTTNQTMIIFCDCGNQVNIRE